MKLKRFFFLFIQLFIVLCLAIAGCDDTADTDWEVDSPENHGMDQALLEEAADNVEKIGGRQGFVMVRHGAIVFEKYYYGTSETRNMAWSVTKCFGGTLVGIAADQGLLDIDDPVTKWIDAPWYTIDEDATIRHLLSQTAESDPPGTGFNYDSTLVINTLSQIVTRASGMKSGEFAKTWLMEPLGITDYTWPTDGYGNVLFGMGMYASCRDIARLGQLYLDGGTWKGNRIVSQAYTDEAVLPAFPGANAGYGFFWWLNWDAGEWHTAQGTNGDGKMIEDAPENFYNATGFLGQLIFVIPDLDIVAVTMGTTLRLETLITKRKFWAAIEPCLPAE